MVLFPYFISFYISHLSIFLLELCFLGVDTLSLQPCSNYHICSMFERIYFWLPSVNVLSSSSVQAQYPSYSMGCLFVGLCGSPTAKTKGGSLQEKLAREDQMNRRFRNKAPGVKIICQLL